MDHDTDLIDQYYIDDNPMNRMRFTWRQKIWYLRDFHAHIFFYSKELLLGFTISHPDFFVSYFPEYFRKKVCISLEQLFKRFDQALRDEDDEQYLFTTTVATDFILSQREIYEYFEGVIEANNLGEATEPLPQEKSREIISEALHKTNPVVVLVLVVLLSVVIDQEVFSDLKTRATNYSMNTKLFDLYFDTIEIDGTNVNFEPENSGNTGPTPPHLRSSGEKISNDLRTSSSTVTNIKKTDGEERKSPLRKSCDDDSIPLKKSAELAIPTPLRPVNRKSQSPMQKQPKLSKFSMPVLPPSSEFQSSLELRHNHSRRNDTDNITSIGTNPKRKILVTPMKRNSFIIPRKKEDYFKLLKAQNVSGYLLKQSRSCNRKHVSFKNKEGEWKRRWFTFENGCFTYFASSESTEPSGRIPLFLVNCVRKTSKVKYGFEVNTPTRDFYLKAESDEILQNWLFGFQCEAALHLHDIIKQTPRRKQMCYLKKWWKLNLGENLSENISPSKYSLRGSGNSESMDFDWHTNTEFYQRDEDNQDDSMQVTTTTSLSIATSTTTYTTTIPTDIFFTTNTPSKLGTQGYPSPNLSISNNTTPFPVHFTPNSSSSSISSLSSPSLSSNSPFFSSPIVSSSSTSVDSPSIGNSPSILRNSVKPSSPGDIPFQGLTMSPFPPNSPHSPIPLISSTVLSLSSSVLSSSSIPWFSAVVHGAQGQRDTMEDRHVVFTSVNKYLQLQKRKEFLQNDAAIFAIFDGHGGHEAAQYAKENLLPYLVDALIFTEKRQNSPRYVQSENSIPTNDFLSTSSFADTISMSPSSSSLLLFLHQQQTQQRSPFHEQISRAFSKTDEEFIKISIKQEIYAGTTANVVILRENKIIVANVGDTRAVLSRSKEAIPLSFDHKPSRRDEYNRIVQAKGVITNHKELNLRNLYKLNPELLGKKNLPMRVVNLVGTVDCYRILGELAVSRAIGDAEYKGELKNKYWENYGNFTSDLVISTPEITEREFDSETEFLIIACDGLWDVIDNQQAVNLVLKYISQNPTQPEKIVQNLVQEALNLGSQDNVSVIVVFFKPLHKIF